MYTSLAAARQQACPSGLRSPLWGFFSVLRASFANMKPDTILFGPTSEFEK